jgi:hypothetical protein
MKLRGTALAGLAAAMLAATAAQAAQIYDFAAFGGGAASTGISFSLPANPTPDAVAKNGSSFELLDVTYEQGGQFPCPCVGDFTFYLAKNGKKGGVDTPAGYYQGPQLFSGPASDPTFLLGDFAITFKNPGSFYNGGAGDVSITLAATAPEPSVWAMLLAGFGLLGATLRQRSARFHARV